MGRRGFDDAQPLHPGPDAGPALGVDDALVEALGGDEQLGEQLGHGAVSGGLRGDPQAVASGETDRLDDVLRGPRRQDGGGTHRDGEVPGRDQGVVARRRGRRPCRSCGRPARRRARGTGRFGTGVDEGHGSSGSWCADDHHGGPGHLRGPCADLSRRTGSGQPSRREWGGHEQPVRICRGAERREALPGRGRPAATSYDLPRPPSAGTPTGPTAAGRSSPGAASSRTAAHPAPVLTRRRGRGKSRPCGPGHRLVAPAGTTRPRAGAARRTAAPIPSRDRGGDQRVDRASGRSARGCCWRRPRSGPRGRGAAGRRGAAGTSAKVSSSGLSARSGARNSSACAGSPSATASMTTRRRPLTSAGSHASSGAWRSRATLVTVSGASPAHSPQARARAARASSPRRACRRTPAAPAAGRTRAR